MYAFFILGKVCLYALLLTRYTFYCISQFASFSFYASSIYEVDSAIEKQSQMLRAFNLIQCLKQDRLAG